MISHWLPTHKQLLIVHDAPLRQAGGACKKGFSDAITTDIMLKYPKGNVCILLLQSEYGFKYMVKHWDESGERWELSLGAYLSAYESDLFSFFLFVIAWGRAKIVIIHTAHTYALYKYT